MNTQIKICCSSYYDARQTGAGDAERIGLSSALHMDGLIPSVATLCLVEEHTELSVMTMICPRGAGFHYLSQDYDAVVEGTRDMIRSGADGIVFGCLDAYGNIDTEQSGYITILAKAGHRQMVFHRAFDCVKDPFKAIEALINMGVDRVLTSGTYPAVFEGKGIIRQLQEHYGDRVEILAGCGIDTMSAEEFIIYTGVKQVHPSCKD